MGKVDKGFKSVIVTDSREQNPLEFKKGSFDEFEVDGLPFGDYWNVWRGEGWEKTVPIAFERKNIGDLFNTLSGQSKKKMEKGFVIPSSSPDWIKYKKKDGVVIQVTNHYLRFKNELSKAVESGFKLVLLVEGSMREVARGYQYSQYSGESMLKKLAMLYVRYDLEYHFFNDRREMGRWIEEMCGAMVRNYKVTGKKGSGNVLVDGEVEGS